MLTRTIYGFKIFDFINYIDSRTFLGYEVQTWKHVRLRKKQTISIGNNSSLLLLRFFPIHWISNDCRISVSFQTTLLVFKYANLIMFWLYWLRISIILSFFIINESKHNIEMCGYQKKINYTLKPISLRDCIIE